MCSRVTARRKPLCTSSNRPCSPESRSTTPELALSSPSWTRRRTTLRGARWATAKRARRKRSQERRSIACDIIRDVACESTTGAQSDCGCERHSLHTVAGHNNTGIKANRLYVNEIAVCQISQCMRNIFMRVCGHPFMHRLYSSMYICIHVCIYVLMLVRAHYVRMHMYYVFVRDAYIYVRYVCVSTCLICIRFVFMHVRTLTFRRRKISYINCSVQCCALRPKSQDRRPVQRACKTTSPTLEVCVHLFAVVVDPSNHFLCMPNGMCKTIRRIVSACRVCI